MWVVIALLWPIFFWFVLCYLRLIIPLTLSSLGHLCNRSSENIASLWWRQPCDGGHWKQATQLSLQKSHVSRVGSRGSSFGSAVMFSWGHIVPGLLLANGWGLPGPQSWAISAWSLSSLLGWPCHSQRWTSLCGSSCPIFLLSPSPVTGVRSVYERFSLLTPVSIPFYPSQAFPHYKYLALLILS